MAKNILGYATLILSILALIIAFSALSKSWVSGSQGQVGLQGPAGISGYEIVEQSNNNVVGSNGLSSQGVIATCPTGKKVLGGACKVGDNEIRTKSLSPTSFIFESEPNLESGWDCSLDVKSLGLDSSFNNVISVKAYAICAKVD